LPEIVLLGLPPTDVRMGQAAQVARTIFSDIADELVRSLDFYKSQVGDVKVDQILLTGPGCLIQNLDQYISNRMNIRTIIADPMRDLVFEPDLILDSMRPILSALVGSSIEPGWNPSFTVNLDLNKEGRLPLLFDERKTMVISAEMRPLPWFKPALTASIAVLVLTLACWAYLVHFEMPAKDRLIAKLTLEETENRKELSALNNLKQSNNILSSKKKLLDGIVKKSQHWSSILDEIRTKTPSKVQLEAIVFDGEKLRIQGHATDFKSISELTVNLSDSSNFQQCIVESETRNERDPDSIAFAVVGDMKNSLSEALPQLSEANHGP